MYRTMKELIHSEYNPGAIRASFWLPSNLVPDMLVASLSELESVVSGLKDDIKVLGIDYDGVIAHYHSHEPPPDENIQILKRISNEIPVSIITNRRGPLLKNLAELIAGTLPLIGSDNLRLKPHPDLYLALAKEYDVEPEEVAIAEDRLSTGIAGANNVGMFTIWMSPPYREGPEPWNVRLINRPLEELVLSAYNFSGLGKNR